MSRHPSIVMFLISVVLVGALVAAGAITRARSRTVREWRLVWVLLVFLAWALVGFG
jgi:hypothetical protein